MFNFLINSEIVQNLFRIKDWHLKSQKPIKTRDLIMRNFSFTWPCVLSVVALKSVSHWCVPPTEINLDPVFDWERDFDTKVWAGPRGFFRFKLGVVTLKFENGCPTESKNYCVYSLPKNQYFNNVWLCVCTPALDLWMCHWPRLKLSSSYYT